MKYVFWYLTLFTSVIFSQSYPNDSYYLSGLQWYIHNDYSGDSSFRNDVDMDILEAWDITKGDPNVVIVILDSGIPMSNGLPSHNDLKNSNRIIFGEDYANDSTPFNDTRGHGTRVAGIAGAETNNSEGIAGIAPECGLMIYKVMDAGDDNKDEWAQRIYDSILDIVNYKNQHPELRFVINISIGFRENDPALATLESAISLAQSNNMLVVAGAGNWNAYSGFDILYPAKYSVNYNNVIAVSSIQKKAQWSVEPDDNFSCFGPEVTVCAPGKDMWSAIPGNSYATDDGTSYSSPIVAGLAALMLSLDKDLTPAQIRSRIINSANDVGETGFDHKTGYGLVYAFNALSDLYVDKNPQSILLQGNLGLSKQASEIYIVLNQTSPSGIAAGHYIVDRYIAQKTVNHSIIDANTWYLGMKGYRSYGANEVISNSYYLSSSISSNSFSFGTYFYYVKYEIPSGQPVNQWIPWNPHVDGGLDYAVFGIEPVAPIISSLTLTPDPVCSGSYGYVYCNLSQGNGTLTYNWTASDLPAGAYITPMSGNKCKVTYSTALSAKGAGVDQIMAPLAQIYCTVSNSAGSDNKSMTPSFSTNCGGCPTLAFNNGTEKVDENTLLISSLSNPGEDVTDYYLINSSNKIENGNIDFYIHEPSEEHSWFDEIELWELRANHGEFIAVTDEGEFINFKETKRNYKYILNNETDITDYLEAEDGKMYPFMPGDHLRIEREKSKTEGVIQETETMYATAIGVKPPPGEKVVSGNIYVKSSKNKLPNVTGEDYGLGGFYFRDNLSTVSKKIGNLTDDDAVEIIFNNYTEIDYFIITNNLKTIKAEKLELISSQKGSENLRNRLLTKDGSYAELFPGEEIRFKYNTQQKFDKKEKIKHVLKIVGRYEKEENSGLLASKVNDDGISSVDEDLPKENKLFDNYPNPFNPTTVIKYEIKEPTHLSLRIFDSLGRLVEVLEEATKSAGRHEVKFDGSKLSSGFYFYQLTSDKFNFTKKMLLVK